MKKPNTPIKSIRAMCRFCMNGQTALIRECHITECPLHRYRFGRRPTEEEARLYDAETTPVKAMRENCVDCVGGEISRIRNCPIDTCPLWPYRMKRNPARKRRSTESPVKESNAPPATDSEPDE